MPQAKALGTVIVLLLAVSIGWVARGWKEGASREAEVRAERQELIESIDLFRKKAQQAETLIAEYKAKQPTVTKIVQTIERPIYRTDCIDDDGLRMVEAAANRSASQSDGEVSGDATGAER